MEIKINNNLYLDDLLKICQSNKEKNMLLNISQKIIPLQNGHYIADEIWYNQVELNSKEEKIKAIDFIDECEDEALSDDWGGLYQSPMEHLGNCEVRFTTGFNNKDKEFKIEKIVIDNDIIIYLKGGNI